ncbi:MAG TPA: MazG nucleotide pyrophosphohydrolase domain-containing protein [Actinomycetota bacterium]|nr:MazG nucleotide pyrophosphohydrolase domain-containing protein [Actinomycetota bacterium]
MDIATFQQQIERIYLVRDRERGAARTFAWLVEEVGELSRALRGEDRENLEEEFADVFAWLASLASLVGVNLETVAASRYGAGCPKCGSAPCSCPPSA